MIFHNAYCSKEFLDHVIDNLDGAIENDIVLNLIKDHCDIIIDVDESEIEVLFDENDVYKALIKREIGDYQGDPGYFSYIPEFESSDYYVNHFSDFFFLKNGFINTSEMREKAGCGIYCVEEISEFKKMNSSLSYNFKPNPGRSTFENWGELLQAKDFSPVNSLVIADNYLFKSRATFEEFKLENLFSIIKAVMPEFLEVQFQVLIVLDNREGNITPEFCENLKNELSIYLGKDEDHFSCGIITTSMNDNIHQRAIILNNYYIWSDKGFNLIQDSKPVKPSHGEFLWNYHSIHNYIGDLQKHRQIDYLNDIYIQKEKNKTSADRMKFNVGNVDLKLFERF